MVVMDLTHAIHTRNRRFWLVIVALAVFCVVGGGQSLDPKWHKLLRLAWAERKGVRFGAKVRQPADAELLKETASFVT
jgi:hypothetical protein